MPCLQCKSTKVPSIAHATLDAKYGTLQDVSGPWLPRDADQYAQCLGDVVPQSRGLPRKEGSNGRLSRSRDTRYGT